MIYVPSITQNTCYYFYNNNTIVELPSSFQIGQTYSTKFIAIDNHYQTYTKQITIQENINCIDYSNLTTEYVYRSDIVSILLYFLFFCLLIVYIPYKFASRFWKWLK